MKISVVQAIGWLASTIGVSASTVFAVMHFAYSDFETQRTTDVYRQELDHRLEDIQTELSRLNLKIDRMIFHK
jgi:hypothetical protein